MYKTQNANQNTTHAAKRCEFSCSSKNVPVSFQDACRVLIRAGKETKERHDLWGTRKLLPCNRHKHVSSSIPVLSKSSRTKHSSASKSTLSSEWNPIGWRVGPEDWSKGLLRKRDLRMKIAVVQQNPTPNFESNTILGMRPPNWLVYLVGWGGLEAENLRNLIVKVTLEKSFWRWRIVLIKALLLFRHCCCRRGCREMQPSMSRKPRRSCLTKPPPSADVLIVNCVAHAFAASKDSEPRMCHQFFFETHTSVPGSTFVCFPWIVWWQEQSTGQVGISPNFRSLGVSFSPSSIVSQFLRVEHSNWDFVFFLLPLTLQFPFSPRLLLSLCCGGGRVLTHLLSTIVQSSHVENRSYFLCAQGGMVFLYSSAVMDYPEVTGDNGFTKQSLFWIAPAAAQLAVIATCKTSKLPNILILSYFCISQK